MDRHYSKPRPGFEAIIEEQGLIYWKSEAPDGTEFSYWNEEAHYSFTEAEVYDMEASARVLLQEMLIAAGDFIIEENLFSRMGIPGWAVPRIKETWESEPPMLYGRFDFSLGPDGFKLLEYNADTPTALLESAAIQWWWAQDVYGEGTDQWNSLHEALVARWKEMDDAGRLPSDGYIYLGHTSDERSGEDFMTVGYMAEVMKAAGLNTKLIPMEKIAFDGGTGFLDPFGERIKTIFKLYPWEWMVHQPFSRHALDRMHDEDDGTTWVEPIWKMLWSNKGILAVLWHLYPDHPNLLPAYFVDAGTGIPIDVHGNPLKPARELLGDYVVKPFLAREGANTKIVIDGEVAEEGPDQDYGEEGSIVQQFVDMGADQYGGFNPVLGVWTVDMEPVGCGIRESPNLITNNQSRFVPHVIAG